MPFNNQAEQVINSHELFRRTNAAIRRGIIKECKYKAVGYPGEDVPNWTNEDESGNYRGPLYRVQFDEDGENKTYWMPQLTLRSGNDSSYWAFEKGEQVIVLCVSGDPMQSFLLMAIPQNAHRPPIGWDDPTSDGRPWRETIKRERFKDQTLFEYRRNDDEFSPCEARFLAAFLGAADSFYQYEAKPDLRKLFIHIKEILIELDKTYTCLAEKDIICKAEEYIEHTAQKDITDSAEEFLKHIAQKDITNDATENIKSTAGENITNDADKSIKSNAGENISSIADKDIIEKAGKDIANDAKNVHINASNDITLKGRNITIKAGQSVSIEAGLKIDVETKQLSLKASQIQLDTGLGAKIEMMGPLIKIEAIGNIEINSIAGISGTAATISLTMPENPHGHV